MLAAVLDKADEATNIVEAIFSRGDSRRAASEFLRWFAANGGRASQREMSEFARCLASGTLSCRLSRPNFYGGTLRRLINLGLISVGPVYDGRRRLAIRGYLAVVQAIPRRRPPTGSFVYRAHLVAERWNELFTT